MKTTVTILSLIILLHGCSSSSDNSEAGIDVIEGTWSSDCIEVNLLPFPMYYVMGEGYIVMELNFDNGDFYSISRFYGNNQCQNVDSEYTSFDGTYVAVDYSQSNNDVKRLDMELRDYFVFYDLPPFTTYYVIEDGILYMNDTLSSDVNINRNVAFTKEN
jgi:hypothetical protein